ncbi:MAG: polyribonucleotide nucleotidyltransferase [Bacteroidia bacterium]|jgi:polyribonucleotide nucleotidyltransferase|nr:polyribonucleotide nucleotidyltransferase [Bacteroidia bacterium]
MQPKATTVSTLLPDGREIVIETGRLAKQAHGSVIVRQGNCMLLATVVSSEDAKDGVDFLPLTVDYQEKFASAGRIPGSFFRREARPTEAEILICRLIDRALRPIFPSDYHADIQIAVTLISADKEVAPDSLAGLAASAAVTISNIPFNGPVSEVRVCRINGEFKINPLISEAENADIDLIVAGTEKDILMVEGECNEIQEREMAEAIRLAHESIKLQCKAQNDLAAKLNVTKREYCHEKNDEELRAKVIKDTYDKVYAVARQCNPNKSERKAGFKKVLEDYLATFTEEELAEKQSLIKKYYHDVEYDAMRDMILKERIRLDGRGLTDIRPIWSEIGYLPSAHGSAVFTRGETQSLTTVTLGTKLDEQIVDQAMYQGTNNFMLHYNFPGFSTGEVKPNRGTSRREVGHGNLALRSLRQIMPGEDLNPYTVRIVSDILESNGSSSMATVCAGSLALMDAGVKITSPISGIAMGLITDGKGNFAVLSDILGDEDHLGDMDFKVTGTDKGICACQMDLKVDGLPYDILLQALEQARAGRLHILGEMNKTISAPAEDYKPHAPRIVKLRVAKEYIGAIIGPGGKIIQEIQRVTGTTITIEEINNEGHVEIASPDKSCIDAALARIRGIVTEPEVGETYEGKVKTITTFGAFVEFMPGKDGLLHISEISNDRLATMDGVFKEGDMVKVKLIEIDKKTGKFRLSRKVLLPNNANRPERVVPENKD